MGNRLVMKRFKYDTFSFKEYDIPLQELNKLGQEGWQLVSLDYVPYGGSALGRDGKWVALIMMELSDS
jgi:hypothetical protein